MDLSIKVEVDFTPSVKSFIEKLFSASPQQADTIAAKAEEPAVEQTTPIPAVEQTAQSDTPETVPQDVFIDELRKAVKEIVTTYSDGKAQVKTILGKAGAASVTELNPSLYRPVWNALQEILTNPPL